MTNPFEPLDTARTADGCYWTLCAMHSLPNCRMIWRALPGQAQEQYLRVDDPIIARLVFRSLTEKRDE